MSDTQTRNMVSTGPESERTFIKLRALKAEEAAKGYYKQLEVGKTVAGTFTGSAENVFKKLDYSIQTDSGTIVIASAGNLGARMQQVPVGAYVEITYKGTNPMKSGPFKGTPAHTFDVLFEKI